MISFNNTEIAFQGKTKKDLNRAFWLFKLVSNNTLVKLGPILLNIALFLRLPILGIIKSTIYKHFCGGESITDSQKTINELAKYQIGTILDYSVEGKETEADFDRGMQETIASIKRAKGDAKIPFSVFKPTGMGRFALLQKVNSKQKLSLAEENEYKKVKERIQNICQTAHDLDVPLFIDAEESWIQNAIDDLAQEMMQLFNTKKAIIYNTLQMYRWDRLAYLKQCYAHAEGKQYFLGLKLVRGAYMEKERERAEKMGYPSPIQKDKVSTDRDYDLAVTFCVENIHRIALCAGTHNEESSRKLTELLEEKGIKKTDARIYFSQLLGMSDHISYNLSNHGFNVAKYVPYGPVKEVMPYLIRRAEENTSIAGQTGRELSLIIKEKKRRVACQQVLVLGDSHARVFKYFNQKNGYQKYIVCEVGGATAQGAVNPNNQTNSLVEFKKQLQEVKKENCSHIAIMLGEVDCGFVIWVRAKRHNISIDEQLNNSVDNLFRFIEEEVLPFFKAEQVILLGSVLPTIKDNTAKKFLKGARSEVENSQQERTELTLRYNQLLLEHAQQKGYHYVDISTETTDPNTNLVAETFLSENTNDHHLSNELSHHLWNQKITGITQ